MNPQSNGKGIDLGALAGQVLALELAVKQLLQDFDNKREFRRDQPSRLVLAHGQNG